MKKDYNLEQNFIRDRNAYFELIHIKEDEIIKETSGREWVAFDGFKVYIPNHLVCFEKYKKYHNIK